MTPPDAMGDDWQTTRTIPARQKALLLIILLAMLIGIVFQMERRRSRQLLQESAKLHETEDGRILGVRFINPVVTAEQWKLIEGVETIVSINLSGTTSVEGGLAPVAQFRRLTSLVLSDCKWMDDAELSHLKQLAQLNCVELANTGVTAAGLRSLPNQKLVDLDLDSCLNLTDDAVDALSGMPQLKTLDISQSGLSLAGYDRLLKRCPQVQVTVDQEAMLRQFCEVWSIDERTRTPWVTHETDIDQLIHFFNLFPRGVNGIVRPGEQVTMLSLSGPGAGAVLPQVLPEFPELRWLTLRETTFNQTLESVPTSLRRIALREISEDSDLSILGAIPSLEEIIIYPFQLSSDDLEPWSNLEKLKELHLHECAVPDTGWVHISRIPAIETLCVRGTPISVESVKMLTDLPRLKEFDLRETGISPEGVDRLRRANRATAFKY